MNVNKHGADWMILSAKINEMLAQERALLENWPVTEIETNMRRGAIRALRSIVAFVEGDQLPETTPQEEAQPYV